MYRVFIQLMTGAAVLVFLVLISGVRAPYGRYACERWGPSLPSRFAWFVQESPSFFVPLFMILNSDMRFSIDWRCRITASAFLVHYVHRALVYPWTKPSSARRVPLVVALMAYVFCCINGYIQGYTWLYACNDHTLRPISWTVGMMLWLMGAAINIHSDYLLAELRGQKGPGYHMPTGGLYNYVSCPNFTGEIMEWLGYAIALNHSAAFAFALFTFANIAPRGVQHHQFYLEKFGRNYPEQRKAVIPFVW